MPQVTNTFSNYPIRVTLDGSGNGTVTFQAQGANVRITNLFCAVATSAAQAVVTIYKGQIAPGNALDNSNSGSTGAKATGAIDLFDGDTIYVQWTGGDPGAVATATFSGKKLDFSLVADSSFSFDDNFAAGDGTIIYPALKSPNYVPGVSGWRIARDGSAEFADVTIRGEFSANNGLVTIDDTGLHLIGTTQRTDIAPTTGVVVYGQPSNGGYAQLEGSPGFGGILYLQPEILSPNTTDPGKMYADIMAVAGPAYYPYISIVSPRLTQSPGGYNTGAVIILGQSNTSPADDSQVTIDASVLASRDRLTVDGNDMGKGMWSYAGNTADSAASTTEQVVLTIASTVYKANRLYRVDITGRIAPAAAAQPLMQVRKTNLAGAVEFVLGRVTCAAAQEYAPPTSIYFQIGGSDVTTALALTLDGGGVSTRHESGSVGRTFTTWDVGLASTMPDVVTVV